MSLIDRVERLKLEKKALLLVHNYQRPEIQDVADYLGDSIELCQKAMNEKDAEILVLSAVDFMAESAAILNPDKKVLIPSLGAKCPMAQMLTAEQVRFWRKKYPGVPVVLYVNTLAEAKAECDVCCTSANAVKVVESISGDTVLFGPDANLAWHVQQKTNKKVIPVPSRGCCPTHILFAKGDIQFLKGKHPDAVVMVHPECVPEVQQSADFIGSTSQMCRFASETSATEFVVGTEIGLIHRLEKENPKRKFIPLYDGAICPNMKTNTLKRIYHSLKEEKHHVTVPKSIAKKARGALERMFFLR